MQSHTKFHLQSISFAVLVLIFAMFSSGDRKQEEVVKPPQEVQLTATVVDATAQEAVSIGEEKISVQNGGDKVALVAEYQPAVVNDEPAASEQKTDPNVTAPVFLVQEIDGEKAIAGYQEDYRWPIASITKLMTAVVALEKIGTDTGVIVSQAAVETEGDAGGFTAGEEFTVYDLVAAMMTVSSNDAAAAVADYVGTPRFFDLMQEKAAQLGMTETSFIDATGLSYLNQSTARDVARLVAYIHEAYPEILELSTHPTNQITELASGVKRSLKNINAFAGSTGFKGGKTGFTEESKGNLVSLFAYDDKLYTLVVFGTADRFAETRKLLSWVKENIKN